MNKAILLGRITKDLELKSTNTNLAYVNFTLAVNRQFKDKSGERQADFISCVAWKQTAEIINKYFVKGSLILVEGSIQTSTYTDNSSGVTKYQTNVLVSQIYFVESKGSKQGQGEYDSHDQDNNEVSPQSFNQPKQSLLDKIDDDLPF